MISRAIFVLTSPEAGEQFLQVLPDLREIGLTDATILHLISAEPGPVEPMPELANWVRLFEATIPNVELALKRGDPVKWIFELARVRHVDIVVISGIPNGTEWDFGRVSSPLRRLGVPILYLPDDELDGSIRDQVLVAVKAPETFERAVPTLMEWLCPQRLDAVRVIQNGENDDPRECSGIGLEEVPAVGDVATTLLQLVDDRGATLVAILADEGGADTDERRGIPVVRPLIETSNRPILIWPAL